MIAHQFTKFSYVFRYTVFKAFLSKEWMEWLKAQVKTRKSLRKQLKQRRDD